MSSSSACGEIILSGSTVVITDTKAYETGENPLIESMSVGEYAARVALAKELGDRDTADARALFSCDQQMLTPGEMESANRYVGAGYADVENLADVSDEVGAGTNHNNGYNSVIMFEDQRDFTSTDHPSETSY